MCQKHDRIIFICNKINPNLIWFVELFNQNFAFQLLMMQSLLYLSLDFEPFNNVQIMLKIHYFLFRAFLNLKFKYYLKSHQYYSSQEYLFFEFLLQNLGWYQSYLMMQNEQFSFNLFNAIKNYFQLHFFHGLTPQFLPLILIRYFF